MQSSRRRWLRASRRRAGRAAACAGVMRWWASASPLVDGSVGAGPGALEGGVADGAGVAVVVGRAVLGPGVVSVDQVVDLGHLALRGIELRIGDPVRPQRQDRFAVE